MNEQRDIAENYFKAFHAGRLDEVFSYFADGGVVAYGTEPEKQAKVFFPEAAEMISQFTFTTQGIYTSEESNNVIIHFSFQMPAENGEATTVEAIDIIEFDKQNKITKVKVIPNT